MTDEGPEPRPELGPGRIIALTDGVVAIAMTLLALDLRPADVAHDASSGTLAHYFRENVGQYAAFVLAFAIVAQYWVVHHRMMRTVTRHDDALTGANMLFLFGVTLLPLTSYVTGTFSAPLATTIFAGSLVLLSVSLALMSEVITRRGLRNPPLDADARLRGRLREATTIAIPLVIGVVTWFVPHASFLFLLFLLADTPGRIVTRKRGRAPA